MSEKYYIIDTENVNLPAVLPDAKAVGVFMLGRYLNEYIVVKAAHGRSPVVVTLTSGIYEKIISACLDA